MSRLLRKEEVCAKVGLCYPTLWNMIRHGAFPPGMVFGRRVVMWAETEVDEWIARQQTERQRQQLLGMAAAVPGPIKVGNPGAATKRKRAAA